MNLFLNILAALCVLYTIRLRTFSLICHSICSLKMCLFNKLSRLSALMQEAVRLIVVVLLAEVLPSYVFFERGVVDDVVNDVFWTEPGVLAAAISSFFKI